ncbi:MAG: kelch repeat-containing protein, partial [Gemmatimonadales bacterium]
MTLLPDGGWLILGGEGAAGPLATAAIWDPRTEETTLLPNSLEHPRAYHTATILPDGTILIAGGTGAEGQAVASVELFDPAKQTFEPLLVTSPTPRSYHTATLLTDGRLLIAGGVSEQGEPLASAELWDLKAQTFETLPEPLFTARHSHSAALLPDGRVLVWGGLDQEDKPLDNGEVYDPGTQQFTFVERVSLPSLLRSDPAPPSLEASLPEDGATDVPRDSVIALRFSKPLLVQTVNADTVTLTGPDGAAAAIVIPAEDGMLAFVTTEKSLRPDATYSLVLDGPTDRAGSPLPLTILTFKTASVSLGAPAGTGLPSDAEEWIPGPEHFQGDWRSRRPDSPWLSLPPLQAGPGVTALAGQVLTLRGQPLP